MPEPRPLRIVVKALILFALANLAFAYFNPTLSGLSIFNHVVKGRVRLPAQRQQNDSFNQGILSFQDMDELFASHVIAIPKASNEYRVILLGDSSIWGWTLSPSDILSEQINRLNLTTCTGKTVRVYDLAYPFPSYLRDLLILSQAVQYHPDLVIWPITLDTLLPTTSNFHILVYQSGRILQLQRMYGLMVPFADRLQDQESSNNTIIGQRSKIKVEIVDQFYGLLWGASGMDAEIPPPHPPVTDLPANLQFKSEFGTYASPYVSKKLIESIQFSALNAGINLASNVPILFFNEPIYIANGQNSSIRYNTHYPRWAYDEYRSSIAGWMKEQQLPYEDFWNAIAASEFADPEVHLTPQGEQLLAIKLTPGILKMACK